MKRNYEKGFSLVELMATVAITTLVLAGVVTTFGRIASSSKNTSKSAALTNSTRGLSGLLASDFASAGRGFSDLLLINIRYQFSESFYTFGPDEERSPYMYAITDLRYDQTTESSEITMNYFDYDLRRSPSFCFLPSEAETDEEDWGTATRTTYEGGRLYSSTVESFDQVKEGDIFLIYPLVAFVEAPDKEKTPWNNYAGRIDAVILQVSQVSEVQGGEEGGTDHMGLSAMMEITFGDGPIFSNKLDAVLENDEPITDKVTFTEGLERKTGYAMDGKTWVARRLGNADSFSRITYEVIAGDEAEGTQVLARRRNGTPDLVATDVQTFKVQLGLDIDPTLTADMTQMERADMDGRVSRMTAGFWTYGKDIDNAWDSTSEDDFRIAIGRHALQAEVEFLQMGSLDTTEQDAEGENFTQRRGFIQQYRIRNMTAPISQTGEEE